MKRTTLCLILGLSGVLLGFAQETSAPKAPASDFKTLMQEIWDGWGTLDPANTAKYYGKDPNHVFYDILPLKYNGWSEYEAGVRKAMVDFSSAKFTVGKDAVVHTRGNFAWATATLDAVMKTKSGASSTMVFRWTVVWERKGGEWLIVHEHVSAPLPPSPAATRK